MNDNLTPSRPSLNRRQFMQASALGLVGSTVGSKTVAAEPSPQPSQTMPMRSFGNTGEKLSLLGMGGAHIGSGRLSDQQAADLVREAINGGVTFMDNAWEYGGGRCEERMGLALTEGYRDRVFLMTKHHGRDKETAMAHLEDSLRRLKTDRIDLWMFHECVYDQDPDRIFSSGGGIEAAELAKQQGKVRYVGFTGHKWPRIHLKMLAYEYPWDAVVLPLNILDGSYRSFEQWVLPVLVQRGIAPLAIKSRAAGDIVKNGTATPEECWRYVASLPVASIISGMENFDLLRKNLMFAKTLAPMTPTERTDILSRTQEVALSGRLERFKSTTDFDGRVGRGLYGV